MPTLHVLQGPDKGRTYETPTEPAVIGRSSEQIQLSDDSASRRHAEIRPDNGSWFLVDLHSSNGTFLNGQRILGPTLLKHGDQIRVGSTLLVFGGEDVPDAPTPSLINHDLVDIQELDADSDRVGASILSSVNASAESVILQPPETADAVAAWNIVSHLVEAIGTTETVDEFLARVADVVFQHLIVDRLILLTATEDGAKLTPMVVRTRQPDPSRRTPVVASRTIIRHAVKTREGVLCTNAMSDDRFTGEDSQDSIHRLGLRSVICVPIVSRDAVHGVFHLDCSMSHHTYTQEQLRLAVAIGRLTGLAIENARLLEARMRTERLAATGETVAYLSHHIRNILQGLQGGAEVVELGMKRKSMDIAESGWALVRRNLDRTLHLAMNMLTFSKERQPRIEPTQLNRIIADVIALVQNRANEQGVIILQELGDLPEVAIDAEGMHQVILNIVLNALDAVGFENGRITIGSHAEPDPERLVVTVGDSGPGIPPEALGRIFDVFHSSKGHAGTGLGLAAARKIVTELGGQISVTSQPGEGTTFSVTVPAQLPAGDIKPTDPDVPKPASTPRRTPAR